MKKRKLIYVLLAGLAFTACSNEDQAVQQPQKQSRPLTIEVTENPLVQDGEEGSNSNRAAIVSSLTSFKLDYVYTKGATLYTNGEGYAYSATNTSGTWSTSGIWPESGGDNTVYWYAYTDGTFNQTEDANKLPYINFTVEEAAASQHDLLVATASGTYSGTDGKLSFTFDHACSALRFYVKKSTNINDKTLTVSSIVLKNVIKDGKYYYGTQSWTLGTTSTDYTLLSSSQTLASDSYVLLNGSEDDSYLFLVPQTLTAWDHVTAIASATTQSYLEVTCSINGGASQTAYVPFGTTLVGGKKYDVKINIGKNSLYSGPNTLLIP